MFPAAALIIKEFSLLSSIEKFIAQLVNSTVNFTLKNRYRMNHEAMSTISAFRVKFTLHAIHQFGNEFFSNPHEF